MKRWNGWGDENTTYHFPKSAANYLISLVGEGQLIPESTLRDVIATVPNTQLPAHSLISIIPEDRLRHARGQSLPDWVAISSNRVGSFPDGVVYANNVEDIHTIIDYCYKNEFNLIPYGGGTSVVGHINPIPDKQLTITLDLTNLNHLIALDETSLLATFEAGVRGPDLERLLNARGFTLGHYPQSYEFSTLGGWIATRSCGQQSYYYGRIDSLFAGGHVITPIGALNLPCFPASAAGPDLRQVILGSEGRFGVITQATLRVRHFPEFENFYGVFFHDWTSGLAAVREIAQACVPVSMLRLSDPMETETTLALSGKDQLVNYADRGLHWLGYHADRCLLICGVTGHPKQARQARGHALEISRSHGGLVIGTTIGKIWQKSRFLTPYLRNVLWERGYAIDTLETALPWFSVITASAAIKRAIQHATAGFNERVLVFAHLSHAYRDGASIYVTYIFRRDRDPDLTLQRWSTMKTAASQVIIDLGGTITHQHGVGQDHAPYLEAEKGPVGMTVLKKMCKTFDPSGILNPGKLVDF